MAGLMDGKRVMVFGVANERSIAWGISQAMHEEGARLGFNFLGDALEKRVRPLAERVDSDLVIPCDVTDDAEVADAFGTIRDQWGGLDVLVHSVAFANREDLDGRFSDTSREGFLKALEISAYSLVHLAREAAPLMADGGSIVTMTYYGAEKVVENYNVMGVAKAALEASVRYLAADLGPQGIRVNAISAGPIKTLAASGVRGFRNILGVVEERAPLRRNVTQEDVGRTALYLCSGLAAGVTGEVIHVDSGYSTLGY
ncbi:MAG TPA: enoyl-ACP reductase [Longimicrobiales bacterium]|nr:enoyl-ACP reductase [Longimicrobiales bacterium]